MVSFALFLCCMYTVHNDAERITRIYSFQLPHSIFHPSDSLQIYNSTSAIRQVSFYNQLSEPFIFLDLHSTFQIDYCCVDSRLSEFIDLNGKLLFSSIH